MWWVRIPPDAANFWLLWASCVTLFFVVLWWLGMSFYGVFVMCTVLFYTSVVLMRSCEQCQSWSATGEPYRRRRSKQMRRQERELRERTASWLASSNCSCKFSAPYQRKVLDSVCPRLGKCRCGWVSCVAFALDVRVDVYIARGKYMWFSYMYMYVLLLTHIGMYKIQCVCVPVSHMQVVYQRTQSASVSVC